MKELSALEKIDVLRKNLDHLKILDSTNDKKERDQIALNCHDLFNSLPTGNHRVSPQTFLANLRVGVFKTDESVELLLKNSLK